MATPAMATPAMKRDAIAQYRHIWPADSHLIADSPPLNTWSVLQIHAAILVHLCQFLPRGVAASNYVFHLILCRARILAHIADHANFELRTLRSALER